MKTKKEAIEKIKNIRKSCGLSRDRLAARSGIIKQSIEKIESGKRTPRIDTYLRLLDALGYEITVTKKEE